MSESKTETFIYRTSELVCSEAIEIGIRDNRIESLEFIGGCPGNLIGISKLVRGMEIDDVIKTLSGVRCGGKPTSCPDQLAQALQQYKKQKK